MTCSGGIWLLKLALKCLQSTTNVNPESPKSRTTVKRIKKGSKEKRYLWKSKRSRYFFLWSVLWWCKSRTIMVIVVVLGASVDCSLHLWCVYCTYVAMDYNISTCNLGRGRKKKKRIYNIFTKEQNCSWWWGS